MRKHQQDEQGITLIESLVIVIIIGIVAAIGTPSLLTMYNNNKVKTTATQIQGVLLDAQRQALRKGRSCQLNFGQDANGHVGTITSTEAGCLISSDTTFSSGVLLTTDLDNITFSFRGVPDNGGRIVVFMPKGATEMRCLEILNGLGTVKTGIYNDQTSTCTIL